MEDQKDYIKKWYIIHTYAGYEKKVKTDLEKRVISENLTDKVFRIMVPEEKIFEEKRGKLVPVLRKIFPSYVMVEMRAYREATTDSLSYKVDSKAWYVIRNTNGVTGFVGVGSDPLPMSEEEVQNVFSKMDSESVQKEIGYKIGDYVITKDGLEGKVENIDYENNKVKLLIQIGTRPTMLTLDCDSVSKI